MQVRGVRQDEGKVVPSGPVPENLAVPTNRRTRTYRWSRRCAVPRNLSDPTAARSVTTQQLPRRNFNAVDVRPVSCFFRIDALRASSMTSGLRDAYTSPSSGCSAIQQCSCASLAAGISSRRSTTTAAGNVRSAIGRGRRRRARARSCGCAAPDRTRGRGATRSVLSESSPAAQRPCPQDVDRRNRRHIPIVRRHLLDLEARRSRIASTRARLRPAPNLSTSTRLGWGLAFCVAT